MVKRKTWTWFGLLFVSLFIVALLLSGMAAWKLAAEITGQMVTGPFAGVIAAIAVWELIFAILGKQP